MSVFTHHENRAGLCQVTDVEGSRKRASLSVMSTG
jgi:hypothetical protein